MPEMILVTEKEFDKARHIFDAHQQHTVQSVPLDEQLLADAILAHNCRAVILGVDPYRGQLYQALGKTGKNSGAIIARFGVGHDGIDKPLARKHNIVITNTPGVLDISVAEHAIWLMGALARNISPADTAVKAGKFPTFIGTELHGRTLAVIGFGPIGRRVAAMAHLGFGMKTLIVDILPLAELIQQQAKTFDQLKAAYGIETYTADINAVLPKADIITIHLPSNAQTERFFNNQKLSIVKPGAFLVNTARGPIIDETALYDALKNGPLAAAALDVFTNEPYLPIHPDKDLRKLPNVLLTPHIGSSTLQANERMAHDCLKNINNFLAGRLDQLTRVDL